MNASYALWRGLIALGMEAHDAWRVAFGEDYV